MEGHSPNLIYTVIKNDVVNNLQKHGEIFKEGIYNSALYYINIVKIFIEKKIEGKYGLSCFNW